MPDVRQYATVSDLELELDTTADESAVLRWERWLASVEARIRLRIPDLDSQVAEGSLPEILLVDVVVGVVARYVRNPAGHKRQNVATGVDDAQVRRDYEFGLVAGRFEILPEEWALLIPDAPGIYSVQMGELAYA